MKKIWFILLFCFIAFEGKGYYENLAGKMFQVKGEITGVIKGEGGVTIVLKTEKDENVLISWDDKQFKSVEKILSCGNWTKIVVKVIEGGIVQGVSAEKIARIVVTKKPSTYAYRGYRATSPLASFTMSMFDRNTLEIYKKTIKYFNPKLIDREAEKIASSILFHSQLNKLDPRLVVAVIAVESEFQVDACSVKGALGLGQLMPQTARILKVNPLDIEENILGTASYLRFCIEQWKDYPYLNLPLALASYNAGPGAVAKHGGIPPYIETQNYVRKVMDLYNQLCSK